VRARTVFGHPFSFVFGGAVALYVALVLAAPEVWLRLASKEGPLEHLGHATLLAAIGLWTAVALRLGTKRRAARWLAAAVAAYLVFALMEEIDWGDVYSLDLGHRWVAELTNGSSNFHNAQARHGSLLGWALFWMSAPMAAFFAAPLLPSRWWTNRWNRAAPARSLPVEGVLFFAAAALTVTIDSVPLLRWRLGFDPVAGRGQPIGAPLGLLQATLYVLWALVGYRALTERQAQTPGPV